MKDLFVLTADEDMRTTVDRLLKRPRSLGIRQVHYATARHRRRDPGCRTDASRRLRPHLKEYRYAMVVFDRDGCGRDDAPREDIQLEVERDLSRNGWETRSKVIVIEPELENWVWSGSIHVPRILGWNSYDELKGWLNEQGRWPDETAKPPYPKEAMYAALAKKGRRVSAAYFNRLADKVSMRGCECPAFGELTDTLQTWFPVANS